MIGISWDFIPEELPMKGWGTCGEYGEDHIYCARCICKLAVCREHWDIHQIKEHLVAEHPLVIYYN